MSAQKDRFRRTLRGVVTRAQLGDDANASPGKRLLDLQRMWVQRAVCRLLAINVGSLAVIVGPSLRVLARNVSRKRPLFAGPGATVCRPLQLLPGDDISPNKLTMPPVAIECVRNIRREALASFWEACH